MKILKNILEKTTEIVKKTPVLKRFYPVIEAADEFFFGTGKTTRFAPHIVDAMDLKRYISMVIVALVPAVLASVYFYGFRALAVIAVSYAFGGITEVIFSVTRKKPLYEGFLATGLIFPLILPPTIPLWMAAVGVVFGVFFGKEVFGGTGRNIFNPALVGRVFLAMAFPEYMATRWYEPFTRGMGGFFRYTHDAVTQATPLINFKSAQITEGLRDLFFGMHAGSMGETFSLGIIIGGIFLAVIKISDWRIPLSYLASAALFAFIGNSMSAAKFAPPAFQLLSGGLLFGAFFMATDPVTAPLTIKGRWVYGVLLGLLTVLIRGLSGFVEGVTFSILLMNAAAPLIDTVIVNVRSKRLNYAEKT